MTDSNEVPDLLAALEASIEAARDARKERPEVVVTESGRVYEIVRDPEVEGFVAYALDFSRIIHRDVK